MSHVDPVLPEPRRVTCALVPGHEEIACIADDVEVLTRVVVLRFVATTPPDEYPLLDVERFGLELAAAAAPVFSDSGAR